ncbi:MAG: NAD-dependent protein deacylase [Clostridiales bacterium]|jgi:NAD-dependent deacetylase|nr:NAD-dependent protein deacylase [Clostridiales bacterium]
MNLRELIRTSRPIAFFGGAGVSTESGIPDFRGVDGLYSQKYKYPPETMLSRDFFYSNPEDFFEFYRDKIISVDAEPNAAHKALAWLEKEGILSAVITQNIDGLHQAAGSENVIEIHGGVRRNHCVKCRQFYTLDDVKSRTGVPRCSCGGVIKPDVTLYGESLDPKAIEAAISVVSAADALIIGGTSLTVYPAAGLIDYYRGDKLALINKTPTPIDSRADMVIYDKIGKALGEAVFG